MSNKIKFVIVFLSSVWCLGAGASVADSFGYLDADNEFRTIFIREQTRRLNQELNKSTNPHAIHSFLFKELNQSSKSSLDRFSNGDRLTISNLGLGEKKVILREGKTQAPLLLVDDLGRGKNARILSMKLSPDDRWLAVHLAPKGAISSFDLVVYDLLLKKVQIASTGVNVRGSLTWVSPRELVFSAMARSQFSEAANLYTLNVESGREQIMPESFAIGSYGDWLLSAKNRSVFISDGKSSPKLIEDKSLATYFIRTTPKYLFEDEDYGYFMFTVTTTQFIIRLNKKTSTVTAADYSLVFEAKSLGLAGYLETKENRIFYSVAYKSWLFYDLNWNVVREVKLDFKGSYYGSEIEGEVLWVLLRLSNGSYVRRSYDLSLNQWSSEELLYSPPEESLISSEVVMAPSKDGTQIPVRILRRNDLVKDGARPTLIESYGGFGLPFQGEIGPMEEQFLLRGGIIVWPALRGGGEYGMAWYQAAMGARNKHKTYEDLIGVAQHLVDSGWTVPSKIISTGTSNGGLTVAASALLSPGSFGLVIPKAGVLDLLNFPELDPSFWRGWSKDYGDPSKAWDHEALLKISPVELAARQGETKFLIMAGNSDDRVNMAHSLKLAAALLKYGGNPENVSLAISENTGHAVGSVPISGLRGLVDSIHYWTYIYDFVGWKFAPSENVELKLAGAASK